MDENGYSRYSPKNKHIYSTDSFVQIQSLLVRSKSIHLTMPGQPMAKKSNLMLVYLSCGFH